MSCRELPPTFGSESGPSQLGDSAALVLPLWWSNLGGGGGGWAVGGPAQMRTVQRGKHLSHGRLHSKRLHLGGQRRSVREDRWYEIGRGQPRRMARQVCSVANRLEKGEAKGREGGSTRCETSLSRPCESGSASTGTGTGMTDRQLPVQRQQARTLGSSLFQQESGNRSDREASDGAGITGMTLRRRGSAAD